LLAGRDVSVTGIFTGADAQTVEQTTTTAIETQINGSPGMSYMSSNSTSSGQSGITVTFDNNTTRSWKLAIERTFTYNNGIVAAETGTHTEGVTTGIAVWGVNRFGNAFSWTIAAPLVVRQDCDFRLVSGTAVHTGAWGVATATFGLDATGATTTCPGTGSYYFKTIFIGANGNTYTFILPY